METFNYSYSHVLFLFMFSFLLSLQLHFGARTQVGRRVMGPFSKAVLVPAACILLRQEGSGKYGH